METPEATAAQIIAQTRSNDGITDGVLEVMIAEAIRTHVSHAQASQTDMRLNAYRYAIEEWEQLNGHLNTCSLCGFDKRCSTYLEMEMRVRGTIRKASIIVDGVKSK
jgi:hypothetical protein